MTHTNTTERDALPNFNPTIHEGAQGVYRKFDVQRSDGDPNGKHRNCEYFVLDTTHDPHAAAALAAYADACAKTHPVLADDLRIRYELRTANASEASAPVAWRVQKSDGTGWYLTSDANEAQHMHENRLLQVQPLYAAPPSDRAAVEGVSAGYRAFLREILDPEYIDPIAKATWERAINAGERARASDTNAAAAPVGQAVDDIIAERDHCEEVIDEILDCVLGTDRPEWSSSYGYADAIRDVENMTTPRDVYRQPTIEDAAKAASVFYKTPSVVSDPVRDDMLAALNSIGCVIAEEAPK